MTTKHDATVQEEAAANDDVSASTWGTWEELLLAFAVNRYGIAAWNSIAAELRKRTSHAVTAQNCRQKYLDLKRRFFAQSDDLDDSEDKSNGEDSVPLLEELKKLRVAELRREVQRYDLNIESLELKMKKMEEERERSARREKTASDLDSKNEEKNDGEPEAKPETGGEPVTGEESEKDQISVNESNSTDLGAEKQRSSEKVTEPDQPGEDDVKPVELKPEPDRKSVGEDSCNGSSNSIEKEPDRSAKAEAASESSQLVGSEAESKGGPDEPMKEYSDTQSSASRSRKEEEEKDKVRRRSTSRGEPDDEDQSRAVKELSIELQPLIDFLQAIRSHKLGSVFERRLRSQETLRYQKVIRKHIDLQTIETRLKEGWYSGSGDRFFRDLLLLVNNALVFFNKNSSETNAALEIRRLIMKELSHKSAKSDSSSGKQVSLQSLSNPKKEEPEPSHSLLLKPRISGSLIVCRKRSSIAAKASGSSSGADRKKEQTPMLAVEKNTKLQLSPPSDNAEEPKITKKRTRDRFPPVSANTKKNEKKPANNNDSKNSVAESGKKQGKGGSSSQNAESKSENKKNPSSTVDSKKRGAANFLNRMKQGSSSNNGGLLAALKNTPLTSESGSGKSEPKKNDSTKRVEKKEHITRRSTEARQAKEKEKEKEKEKGSPTKRNVGRPPKRGAAPAPAPTPAPSKRGRDRGEVESSGSKQPKKRSRKL